MKTPPRKCTLAKKSPAGVSSSSLHSSSSKVKSGATVSSKETFPISDVSDGNNLFLSHEWINLLIYTLQ